MSTKECPSCGRIIEDGQAFCPACGTKIQYESKSVNKKTNPAFKLELLTANDNAAAALSYPFKRFTTIGHYQALDKSEKEYLTLIQKYPTEPEAYTSYVDFMIKYILKIMSLPFSVEIDIDVPRAVSRCRAFLDTAKTYADDAELEKILQLDSALSQKVEAIATDEQIEKKHKQNAKKVKSAQIAAIIIGVLVILAILVKFL